VRGFRAPPRLGRSRAWSVVGVLPRLTKVLGAAHGVGRVDGEEADSGEPVKTRADGGEVLFDGRLGHSGAEGRDVGGDMERLDTGKLVDFLWSTQAKKSATAR
jgi:hypothetical protein